MAGGRCREHRQQRDQERGSAASRGYGPAHRARRESILDRDPWCVACLALRRHTPTTVDDHIVPISAGGSEDDQANQQGLCTSCHGVKRAAESRGRQLMVRPGRGLVDVGPLQPAMPSLARGSK